MLFKPYVGCACPWAGGGGGGGRGRDPGATGYNRQSLCSAG